MTERLSSNHRSKKRPKIVLGVTVARSLKMLTGLAEQLTTEGWEVHIVSDAGPESKLFKNIEVSLHTIPMERDLALGRDLKALFLWTNLMRKINPDIVLVGTPKAGLLGLTSSWINRTPVRVYHLRGLRLESTQGIKRKILENAEKLSFGLATHALSVSESLRSLVIELGLTQPTKITVLGRGSSKGVDTARFRGGSFPEELRQELRLEAAVPVVGFVGRITRDKGSEDLLQASRELSEKGIDHQLLIVGAKEGASSDGAGLNLKRPPIFAGHVKDIKPYYKLMDILCLPTYREGFPNVVLEAGASGVPAVTTDATGAIDSVLDGQTGLIVSKGSSRELAIALEKLLVNQTLRAELGKNARCFISENFEERAVQKATTSYLNDLIAKRRT